MARLLDRIAANPKVREVYQDSDGYWASLKPGWVCNSSGAHSCHEQTQRELAAAVSMVEPCPCEHCKRATST